MLARIRPDGLVCRLLRQEKHNTSLVNVRCRRGCVFFSLPLPLLPMATALRWDHCCSTSNDGDCCWTTTRRCFGGSGDTCRRDTSQRRAGRGGGRRCVLVDTRPAAARLPHRTGSAPPLRGAARDAEDETSGATGCGVRGEGPPGGQPSLLPRADEPARGRSLPSTNIRLVQSSPVQTNSFYALLSQQEI